MGECFCNVLKHIDLFGKEAKLFYRKEEQFNTNVGIISSLVYYLIYIGFFIYKLNRLTNHLDVTAYDTFKYISYKPSIELSNNIFYGGFALQNPKTYDSIVDESIYYAKAYYKKAVRKGDNNTWDWEIKPLDIEICNITKFGKDFKSVFKNNTLNNLYCFKKINESFIGHFSFDNYSFFFLEFYPCRNSTENNNKCKTQEEIDFYLNSTFLSMAFEDVELSPDNYHHPVTPRNQDIYFKIGKKSFQEVHVFFQILNVETDKDFFGLEFNEIGDKELATNNYLKFHSMKEMMTIVDEDIYQNNNSFCTVTFKLHEQIRIQRRTYAKLFSIWGDVGGFMEFIKVILNLFLNSIIAIKYEIEIANNLFQNKNKKDPKRINYNLLKFIKINFKKIKTLKCEYILRRRNTINNNNNNNINLDNNLETITIEENRRKREIVRCKTIKNKEKGHHSINSNEILVKINNSECVYYNLKKNVEVNCLLTHICSCCLKCFKKNDDISFLKKATEMFSERLDIYNLFHIIINISKKEKEIDALTI